LLKDWGCEIGDHAPKHWHQYVSRILASGRPEELETPCDDRIFSLTITPVVDSGYVNVYGSDVTERKRAEEDLRQYRQHLEELVAARTTELQETNERLRLEIDQRKQLEKQLLEISEREKRLIGQELHDSIGQQFTGIAFMTKVLEKRLTDKLPDEAAGATEIRKLVNEAMSQTRILAKGLHPVDLDAESLMSALQELAATTERLFGVNCTFGCDKPVPIHDTVVAVNLYRIAQEAVNNAIKHGKAGNIRIGLVSNGGQSVLTVKNDGLDFGSAPKKSGGMGLNIMQHRAEIIKGSLDICRGASGGAEVTCIFPNDQN
ncbi:MAG: PAS domain-containing sensor histidine kinase, partial [Planctomycetota bacterium]